MSDFDVSLAHAEAGLDRIDDDELVAEDDLPEEPVEVIEESDGWHVEDEATPLGGDGDLDEVGHLSVLHDDLLDALNEAFNARDIDGVLDVLAEDVELPGLAGDRGDAADRIEDLWERRPTCLLTRAVHGGEGLSVLWEISDEGTWYPLATVRVDDVDDGRAGILEFSEDVSLIDELDAEMPDGELDEGARWEEWEEGAID